MHYIGFSGKKQYNLNRIHFFEHIHTPWNTFKLLFWKTFLVICISLQMQSKMKQKNKKKNKICSRHSLAQQWLWGSTGLPSMCFLFWLELCGLHFVRSHLCSKRCIRCSASKAQSGKLSSLCSTLCSCPILIPCALSSSHSLFHNSKILLLSLLLLL